MKKWMIGACAGCFAITAHAAALTAQLHSVSADGQGAAIGSVSIEQSAHGLIFTPQLQGLEPGVHGFHLHANPSCAPAEKDGKPTAAAGAGGHWDPKKTNKHDTPWGEGHLGDLPALLVTEDGKASQPVLAPRIKQLEEVKGLAIMVHQGGDNHADHPKPLGGGGERIACGVIQ
ncbi:superoxide dismutase [Cu-Zn] SodC [Pseudomonas borbori]